MLNYFLYLNLYMLFTTSSSTNFLKGNIQNFLNHRLQYVKEEFSVDIPDYLRAKRDVQTLEFNSFVNRTYDNISAPNLLTLFNNSYIFDKKLYEIIPSEQGFILEPTNNFTINNNELKFARSFNYNNTEFLLFCFENSISRIYVAKNIDNINFIQGIKNPKSIKDAKFFKNNGKLYLVTTSNFGSSLTTTLIYQWLDTYFDQIDEHFTNNLANVYTFSYKNSEIIAVLPNSIQEKTTIYKFANNKMEKIQLLKTRNPYYMTKYEYDNQIYLIIFNKGYATLYLFSGFEFVFLTNFVTPNDVEKAIVSYTEKITTIFVISKTNVLAYSPSSKNIHLLQNDTLETSFEQILDGETITHDNNHILYFFGQKSKLTELVMMQFKPYTTTTGNIIEDKGSLKLCLSDLEDKLKSESNFPDVPYKKISQEFIEIEKQPDVGQARKSDTEDDIIAADFEKKIFHLDEKYSEIYYLIHDILSNIQDLFHVNTGIINGRVTVSGNLQASNLHANSINIKKLNKIQWTPEQWLSYSQNQTIPGYFKINHIKLHELEALKDNIFKDALPLVGNPVIHGPVKIKSLQCTDLYTGVINDVPFSDLYFRTKPELINGTKKFNTIKLNILNVDYLNNKSASDILKYFADSKSHAIEFGSNVKLTNLMVDYINDVQWNIFKDSVFKIGKTSKITGHITAQNLKITNLNVRMINDIDVENFLTTSTKQTINSKINFGNINCENVNCSNINGVDFRNNAATLSDFDKIIKGPVTINRMSVSKNITVMNGSSINFTLSDEHIIGTQISDLHQIYQKVKIVGNVRAENFTFLPSAKILVNGNDFDTANIVNQYWLKHTDQTIPEHVQILNGASVPNLLINMLNGVKIDDYMLDNLDEKETTNYYFENITVVGNIVLDYANEHFPNFKHINESAVKLTGRYDIFGAKSFKGKLTINQVKLDYLDNVTVKDTMTIHSQEMLGKKQFENLIIKSLNCNRSYIYFLNGIELRTIYNHILPVDHPVYFGTLKMRNITVHHLVTDKINDEKLNKYLLNRDNLHAIKELSDVEIYGNITMRGVTELKNLNHINFHVIAEKISGEPVLIGDAKFLNKIHIKHFITTSINNVDMEDLMKTVMYRYWPQEILKKQYFKILRTPVLISEYINDMDFSNIIDTKKKTPQTLSLRNKLIIDAPIFFKSLSGKLPCDIHHIFQSIYDPPPRHWSSITILQNATIHEDENSLKTILDYAVTKCKNNYITTPVTFSKISAKDIHTKECINNVNIQEIYEDALMKYNNDELITGFKTFEKVTVAGATVHGYVDIPIINKLIIQKIDENIIDKNNIFQTVIKGHKLFLNGLETMKLITQHISNIDTNNLVNTDDLRPIPEVFFDSLHVLHNFHIYSVNQINFDEFLQNRLLKNCVSKQILTGTFYFDNLFLYGNTNASTINSIDVEDVVFDIGVQNIPLQKEFTKNVIVYGNIYVDSLNDVNITEKYENAILIDESIRSEANMVFEEVSEVSRITTNNLNNMPIESIKAMLKSESTKIKVNIVRDTIEKIENILEKNSNIPETLPQQYLYLDKLQDIQVAIPNTVSAQVIQTKGHAYIHVLGKEPGYTCGLPLHCNCPVQNTIQITPELSVNFFTSKVNQRVYSFEDETITVHVISNSISYSPDCINSNASISKEDTVLTWTNMFTGKLMINNSTISNSYVSGVEFFGSADYVYIIIGRSYDIQMRKHALNCSVLRLDKMKDIVEVIQEIPTTGTKFINLFYSPQAINLLIKNIYDSGNNRLTIYRFDMQKEEFYLLRNIDGIDCTTSTSIALQNDSFIILGQRNSKVSVWKYNNMHSNYYFYQEFGLDSQVLSVSAFYEALDFSDAFIAVVTKSGNFYIYTYRYLEGWILLSNGEVEGLRLLEPFNLNKQTYLFAPSAKSSLISVVKNGRN